jgi:hypothetical protein
MPRFAMFVFALTLVPFAPAQKKAATPSALERPPVTGIDSSNSARLPVKRVVLYKNGIGYFEHTAHVHGNQDLAIDFTTGQLNDVLKSLTVVDLGEGRIGSVRYNSIAPLDERLRSLRLPFGEQVTNAEFLLALRGARVDVRSGTSTASGRLLSVEKERKQNGKGDYADVTTFAIVTDGGEMRNFELGPGTSVRLAERELSDEVGRYLNLVGSARARDLRRMTISAMGSGDRDVFVSYISEVPVWKSTYRIILSDKPDQKPLLQGWAIVDNTVGEDWKDVQLSLVAGAPQSFIQNISQPYYTRRPRVALPEAYMLTPQTHELAMNGRNLNDVIELSPGVAGSGGGIGSGSGFGIGSNRPGTGGLQGVIKDTAGAVVSGATVTVRNEDSGQTQTTTTDARGIYRFYNLPPGNSALFVRAQGFQRFDLSNAYLGVGRMNEVNATLQVGAASETVEVRAEAATLNTESTSVSSIVSNQHVEAETKDAGDFFEYEIKQKITISKNQSALVPILSAHVEAEKVSLWNEEDKEIRRALWLKNSSGLTVDSGTFNILESDTFGGEGVLETLHADERRLISYAADPALHIAKETEGSEKPVSHLRIAKGVMVLTREQREIRKYTIHNADKTPRQLVIEHPARQAWTLVEGAVKPEETTASFLRFRVSVAPAATEHLAIEEHHPEDQEFELDDLDEKQVSLLIQGNSLTPAAQQAMQQALGKVLEQKNQVAALENQITARQHEIDAIGKDQGRLRENMKALKGSVEEKALLQRYTRQLDQQEDRLTALQNEVSGLNTKKDKADEDLTQMIQSIVLDERF